MLESAAVSETANSSEQSASAAPRESVNPGVPAKVESGVSTPGEGVPAASAGPIFVKREKLRMRPFAKDFFMTFVYFCVAVLLVSEFVALFWLDLFD